MNDDPTGRDSSPLAAILANLPPEVVESFTPEQRAALWRASTPMSWRRFPIDLRLSLPFGRRRYFLTLVAGPERRAPERRRREETLHPWVTRLNLLFLLCLFGAIVLVDRVVPLLLSNLITL